MSQQQQQVNTAESGDVNIDYLAINRARWDERAPHVSHDLACSHVCRTATYTYIQSSRKFLL